MLVSMSDATIVEVLPLPSSVAGLRGPVPGRIPGSLPFRGTVVFGGLVGPGDHPDRLAGGEPIDLSPWFDPVSLRDRLGDGDLELAGYLRHVLTLARTHQGITTRRASRSPVGVPWRRPRLRCRRRLPLPA